MRKLLSEVAPVLIAAIFLVVPVSLLVRGARKQHDPEETYRRAVYLAMVPDHIAPELVSERDLQNPVTVVTWKAQSAIAYYKGKEVTKDTWVTVVPHLRSFCRDFERSHGSDPAQLNLRLKQRLGLPPEPDYDSFVEFKVDPRRLFRPCNFSASGDTSTATDSCAPISQQELEAVQTDLQAPDSEQSKNPSNPGKAGIEPNSQPGKAKLDPPTKQRIDWLLAKYYQSFSSTPPYPWTSLGYTFDWAPAEDSDEGFVTFGESEFVVPAGTPILQFAGATDTAAYCAP